MLQQEQQVRDAIGLPFFHQHTLHDERIGVRNGAETTDLEWAHELDRV